MGEIKKMCCKDNIIDFLNTLKSEDDNIFIKWFQKSLGIEVSKAMVIFLIHL